MKILFPICVLISMLTATLSCQPSKKINTVQSSTKKTNTTDIEQVRQLAQKELGEKVTVELNPSNTYAFCYIQTRFPAIKYRIYKLANQKVIKSGSFHGSISWSNDSTLKCVPRPEVIKKDAHQSPPVEYIHIDIDP